MLSSVSKKFFASMAQKAKIYRSVGDHSFLPKKLEGIVQFDPGIAVQVTSAEYKAFVAGNAPSTRWPVSIYFRTHVSPHVPDGLPDEACIWYEKEFKAEILAYSVDHGVTPQVVNPLDEDDNENDHPSTPSFS